MLELSFLYPFPFLIHIETIYQNLWIHVTAVQVCFKLGHTKALWGQDKQTPTKFLEIQAKYFGWNWLKTLQLCSEYLLSITTKFVSCIFIFLDGHQMFPIFFLIQNQTYFNCNKEISAFIYSIRFGWPLSHFDLSIISN